MTTEEPIMLAEIGVTVVYEFRNDDDDEDDGISGGGSVWFGPSWTSGTDAGVITSSGGSGFSGGFVAPDSPNPSPSPASAPESAPAGQPNLGSPQPTSPGNASVEPVPTEAATAETPIPDTAMSGTTPAAPGTTSSSPSAVPGRHSQSYVVKVPSSPITKIWTRAAANDSERLLQDRLKVGDGTPEEALRWFQEHGFPGLTERPAWVPDRRLWLFPSLFGAGGTAGSQGSPSGAQPGVTAPAGGSATGAPKAPPPGSQHGGLPAMFGTYHQPRQSGSGTRPAARHPRRGEQPGSEQPGSDHRGIGEPSGPRDRLGSGQPLGPGDLPDEQPSGQPPPPVPVPAAPAIPAPTSDDSELPDENPFLIPASRFATDQVEGAIRDIMDSQAPMVAKLVLANFLPEAYLAMLMEQYILNPVLAAPAHLYEAARREYLALEAIANGDAAAAISQDRAAAHHLREAALAILAIVPFGEGATASATAGQRLAAGGVELLAARRFLPSHPSLVHQMWVTGQAVETVFKLPSGKLVFVDGFINRTGINVVDRLSNMVLVEVKMDTRIAQALEPTSHFDLKIARRTFTQFNRYIEVARRLRVGGVRYVITEATPGQPMTNAFREALRARRPELFASGFLEVFATPPPPPTFRQVLLNGKYVFDPTAATF